MLYKVLLIYPKGEMREWWGSESNETPMSIREEIGKKHQIHRHNCDVDCMGIGHTSAGTFFH